MWQELISFAQWTLLLLLSSCSATYTQRDETASNVSTYAAPAVRSPSETDLLRAEVQNLRAALADRDRRDAEMLRTYVTLSQRVDQLLAQQKATLLAPIDIADSVSLCKPPSTSMGMPPPKSIIHAINRSQLSFQQKRDLLQSLKPPRVIDNTNPWVQNIADWPSDMTNETLRR